MLTVQLFDVARDPGVDRRGLERLELARLADAAADGLPLGVDDLHAATGAAERARGLPCPRSGRSQPAMIAARTVPARENEALRKRLARGMASLSGRSGSRVVVWPVPRVRHFG